MTELQSGVADLAAGTPMSPQDHYRIGSLTKTYVSTAVLDLVAEHRIRLKDPVKRYLPGFLTGGRGSPSVSCSTTPAACTSSTTTRASWRPT